VNGPLSASSEGENSNGREFASPLKSKRNEQKFEKPNRKSRFWRSDNFKEKLISSISMRQASLLTRPSLMPGSRSGRTLKFRLPKVLALTCLGYEQANDLTPFIVKGSVDTAVAVACFNEFSQNLKRRLS